MLGGTGVVPRAVALVPLWGRAFSIFRGALVSTDEVGQRLAEFRANRREFVRRLLPIPPERRTVPPAPGEWSAREYIAHAAAWIERGNDRIPRLMAGAPSEAPIDQDAFNAAAVERAQDWTAEQALAALNRAADRYEAIVGESDPVDLADSEDVMGWLKNLPNHFANHYEDIDRLVACSVFRDT